VPKIVKEMNVRAPLQESWDLVSDMERFSACIPGCKEVKKVDDDCFDWVMEAKVMRTKRQVKARTKATRMDPPKRAEFTGEGRLFERSNHYRLTISGATDLEPLGDSMTRIVFSGDVSASGVGGALIEKVAAGQMDQLFDEFEGNLKKALGDHSA
jgi:carbon monoxide dehydrogenase subunit G